MNKPTFLRYFIAAAFFAALSATLASKALEQPVSQPTCSQNDWACIRQNAALDALRTGKIKGPIYADSKAECDSINFAVTPPVNCIVRVADDAKGGK
jgi:hypothetical protein